MRISTCAATVISVSLVLAGSLLAQNSSLQGQDSVTLTVLATMDIYRAGGYDDGSNGIAPVLYSFPARQGQTITFPSVTGEWACTTDAAEYGPEGTGSTICYDASSVDAKGGQSISNPTGTFSGYATTDFLGALVGVFLEDALPREAPASFRFYVIDSSKGGIRTDFRALAPRIGQTFFIGDGLTGYGSGAKQVFKVPPTATRLYLGYLDTCTLPGPTAPGCYSDNVGALTAVVQLQIH